MTKVKGRQFREKKMQKGEEKKRKERQFRKRMQKKRQKSDEKQRKIIKIKEPREG